MRHGSKTIASPLWAGFDGKSLPASLSRWLADGQVGGVVLYSRNIESPAQVRALCKEIRSAAGRGNPLPLIAVDQEGGRVARFKDPPFTWFPPARACSLFCCRNETVAEAVGAATAAELRAVGIDVNFAPVLDVDSNPANPVIGDRAFSEDPHAAAALAIAFAKGSLSRGILPVGKHFPGHGDTSADSHKELPVVRAGRRTLLRRELLPFRLAARAGIPALMTAHVVYPALDPALPATLSPKILHGLLRRTDALSRRDHLRRAGDEGDRGSLRDRGGGGPRRGGRVRRGTRLPGRKRAGGDDRPPDPGGYRPPGVSTGDGGGGGSIGTTPGVGGGERTLSTGATGGGSGAASTAFFTSAGGLGKYRANISGR